MKIKNWFGQDLETITFRIAIGSGIVFIISLLCIVRFENDSIITIIILFVSGLVFWVSITIATIETGGIY